MKKISIFSCLAAALLTFAGCEPTGNDGYEGINYINLTSEGGKISIFESEQTPIVVNVMLTAALDEDLVLTFAVAGPAGVVELQDNPVTIAAGDKAATFQIVSLNAGQLDAAANFVVGLDESVALPENVQLKSGFAFVVNPAPVENPLTEEQRAIIAAYKKATGIDLSKYIGAVSVSTVITGTDPDSGEIIDPVTVEGQTVIELSETSTEDAPVLKMTANAMGLDNYMYQAFNSMTVEHEYWVEYPNSVILMESINWNKEKVDEESFSVSLDGITLNQDKTLDFLGTFVDFWEEERTIVPFAYEFSAYNRELEATANGTLGIDREEGDMDDSTANPSYHLNLYDITPEYVSDPDNYYEGENWVEASAVISETSLTFTFAVHVRYDDYDYTRFVATYTPNN